MLSLKKQSTLDSSNTDITIIPVAQQLKCWTTDLVVTGSFTAIYISLISIIISATDISK